MTVRRSKAEQELERAAAREAAAAEGMRKFGRCQEGCTFFLGRECSCGFRAAYQDISPAARELLEKAKERDTLKRERDALEKRVKELEENKRDLQDEIKGMFGAIGDKRR